MISKKAASIASRLLRVFRRRAPDCSILDLQGAADGVEAFYEGTGTPCLITVRLDACRWAGASGQRYGHGSSHPYVQTLTELHGKNWGPGEPSYLKQYWEKWQPRNLAEYFGLPPEKAHPLLVETPPIHSVLPWSPARAMKLLEKKEWLERRFYRRLWEEGCSPARSCGPKPDWFHDLRLKSLLALHASIERHGYRPKAPRSHIKANCMVSGEELRYMIADGQHRAAVLSALGWEEAPILVHAPNRRGVSLIRREDVRRWPLVRRGVFSEEQALSIFDRIFHGSGSVGKERMHGPSSRESSV